MQTLAEGLAIPFLKQELHGDPLVVSSRKLE
jgi:hypothetical protein